MRTGRLFHSQVPYARAGRRVRLGPARHFFFNPLIEFFYPLVQLCSQAQQVCPPPRQPCPLTSEDNLLLRIDALPSFVGVRCDQFRVGIKEVVGGRENVASPFPRRLKTPAHGGPRLLGRAAQQAMKLIKPANHAHPVANPPLGFCQVHIAAHGWRSERLHSVRLHGGDFLQDRHHAAASVVHDALPGLVGQRDQFRVVGRNEPLENPG